MRSFEEREHARGDWLLVLFGVQFFASLILAAAFDWAKVWLLVNFIVGVAAEMSDTSR